MGGPPLSGGTEKGTFQKAEWQEIQDRLGFPGCVGKRRLSLDGSPARKASPGGRDAPVEVEGVAGLLDRRPTGEGGGLDKGSLTK